MHVPFQFNQLCNNNQTKTIFYVFVGNSNKREFWNFRGNNVSIKEEEPTERENMKTSPVIHNKVVTVCWTQSRTGVAIVKQNLYE